jgi:hypothetical protein
MKAAGRIEGGNLTDENTAQVPLLSVYTVDLQLDARRDMFESEAAPENSNGRQIGTGTARVMMAMA